LIRRHPHVFGDLQVEGSADVLRNWEMLKKEERGDEGRLLDHVPKALPALAQAQSVQSRAAKAGLAPETMDTGAVLTAVRSLSDAGASPSAEQLGDALMSIVAVAAERGLDAEDALRLAIGRYRGAVGEREAR
jgi:uncharacterized protein YabN with tetrapyrrole methylase and pyrophosphatase domain